MVDTIKVGENHISYHGSILAVFAVHINGHLVSDVFPPFDATFGSLSSRICEECYAATLGESTTCGQPSDISVRRHNDSIYWFLAEDGYGTPLTPNAPEHHVWSFRVAEYESQLAGNTSQLPDFSSADIHSILKRATVYPPQFGLFTVPDIKDDPQGRMLLRAIVEVVESDDLLVCPAPDQFRTIRIGIETKLIPETVVALGVLNRRCVVRFVANPSFPLWLTSEEAQHKAAFMFQ